MAIAIRTTTRATSWLVKPTCQTSSSVGRSMIQAIKVSSARLRIAWLDSLPYLGSLARSDTFWTAPFASNGISRRGRTSRRVPPALLSRCLTDRCLDSVIDCARNARNPSIRAEHPALYPTRQEMGHLGRRCRATKPNDRFLGRNGYAVESSHCHHLRPSHSIHLRAPGGTSRIHPQFPGR